MSPPRRRQHAAGCIGARRKHRADRVFASWRFGSRGPFRQTVELVELSRFDRLQREMALSKSLNAAGCVEPRPFGAKDSDRVAFASQFTAQFGDALGLQGRIELDFVDEGCRED